MPRFFFDITDVHGHHRDNYGDDLRSFEDLGAIGALVIRRAQFRRSPRKGWL